MQQYELILFDIDGTLADRDTSELLPGVREWFEQHHSEHQFALITNQGGVGLRFWMEDGGFGEPEKFPTEEQARAHIDQVNTVLPGGPYPVHVCFAYQSKKSGKWAPVPGGCEDDPEWMQDRRKPATGMIFDAIRELQSSRAKTLMVGDREEDRLAAENAGINFMYADDFFTGVSW